jgi:hypothetical protein
LHSAQPFPVSHNSKKLLMASIFKPCSPFYYLKSRLASQILLFASIRHIFDV